MRTVVEEEKGRRGDKEIGEQRDTENTITDHGSRITQDSQLATRNPQPVPNGLWLYRVDRKRGLLGGATSEGGNLFAWLRNTLQLPPLAELEADLAASSPAAHGLIVLPFIAGERAPGWNEMARASIIGFSQHTQPVEIMQAALEGIAYRLAIIHQRLTPYLPADHRVIASGGALLSSPAWMQIMADVLGRPVVALTEKEITGRGLAVLALETLGLRADVPDPELAETYMPDAGRHALHQAAAQRQQELYRVVV